MIGRAHSTGRGAAGRGEPAAGGWARRSGVVLLEVVLALSIFFCASLALLAATNIALRTARRVQLEAQAADLAISLLSEIQMGQRVPADEGPEPYEDEALEGWTWETTIEPVEEDTLLGLDIPQFLRVEIIIRYEAEDYAYRLVELMTDEAPGEEPGMPGPEGPPEDEFAM